MQQFAVTPENPYVPVFIVRADSADRALETASKLHKIVEIRKVANNV